MDAKEYHKNPRRISNKQMRELQQNLQDLGDLSGIILDLNSMELIGGNQRSKVMNLAHCEIEYIEQNETPDAQGTVSLGFVLWKGKKYNYREVRWSPEQLWSDKIDLGTKVLNYKDHRDNKIAFHHSTPFRLTG